MDEENDSFAHTFSRAATMSLVARGFPEQAVPGVSSSMWRVSVTVGNDEDSRFKVPCGDGTLTVEALAKEIAMRYAILKRGTDDRPSAALTLRDARGAQLFLEDRVCDVLRNRARVSASGEGRSSSGHPPSRDASRPAPKRKRDAARAPAYERDDASFEYFTPSSADLLANAPPNASARPFACPCCPEAFALNQNLMFHITKHRTAKMTAEARAEVEAAIQGMDTAGGGGAREDADETGAEKKERRFFCPNPECEHNPEVEAGAHPFASFKLCRQHYLRRHSAERPHACPKCGRAYAVKADMQTHAKHCAEGSGQTCPGAAGPARDKREGERADGDGDGDADFEVVAGEETEARERDAPRREAKAEAPKKKKKVSESSAKQRRGGDEPLVPKRAKFASGSSGEKRGGRSYEETATAARRKGSGAARAKPSRGFSKPSRG